MIDGWSINEGDNENRLMNFNEGNAKGIIRVNQNLQLHINVLKKSQGTKHDIDAKKGCMAVIREKNRSTNGNNNLRKDIASFQNKSSLIRPHLLPKAVGNYQL